MISNRKPTKLTVSAGSGKYHLTADLTSIGDDIIVSIWGGTKPHIGSVVASIPRPSLDDPHRCSATSSVINFAGHKDEAVARMFSEKIAASFNTHTVVTAGIHVDNLTGAGMRKILDNSEILCSKLIKKWRGNIGK